MLPKLFDNWHKNMLRPSKKTDYFSKEDLDDFIKQGIPKEYLDSISITLNEAEEILRKLGISSQSIFYEFYKKFKNTGSELYNLEEILENYQNPHPLYAQYPQIGKRYLQISSAEGEHSYFYDKETDAVYSVDWSQLDDLNAGKLKPMFNSFYDFLEWYYSEEDED